MLKIENQIENLPEILILEDDKIFALLHKYLVEKVIKINPLLFTNGKEAIDYLDARADKDSDVLVLLDINMPLMNGWEFLKTCKIRKYKFNVQAVLVTSSLFKEDRKRAKEFDEIRGFYTKPFKVEDLQEIFIQEKEERTFNYL
ncbi:response regulator [Salinimicrobium sp. WS361]|jgi:CheY-like chemotaxis protein|uniref:response regulator n=1 Tax=Salinimicrobium sp. WS361 TaxID=3425123 RepID=UPI003D6EFA9E